MKKRVFGLAFILLKSEVVGQIEMYASAAKAAMGVTFLRCG
jgi:hypothetical protein